MDTDEQTLKKTELVIKALNYAEEHNLDINNEEDVKKILDVIDTGKLIQNVPEFIQMLQAGNAMIERDVKRRKSVN